MANILVIDDDQVLLKIMDKALNVAGHTAFFAATADVAFAQLAKEKFDLVITDIHLPGSVSGYSIVNHIRTVLGLKNIPVIFLSGRNDKSEVLKALQLGASAFMVKPLNTDVLYEKIEEVLAKKDIDEKIIAKNLNAHANANFTFTIQSISESFIEFESLFTLPAGVLITFESQIFNEISLSNPKFKIVTCTLETPKSYLIRASFADLSDLDKLNLKNWLQSKKQSRKAA